MLFAQPMNFRTIFPTLSIFAFGIAAVSLLSGCDQTFDALPHGEAADGTFELVSSAPIHFDGQGSPYFRELLRERGFIPPKSGAPQSPEFQLYPWVVHPSSALDAAVRRIDVTDGETTTGIAITSSSTESIMVEQESQPLPDLTSSAWVVARMRMQAPANASAGLVLNIPTAQGVQTIGQPYPGNGGWEDVVIAVPVSHFKSATPLKLAALCGTNIESDVEVMNASLAVYPDAVAANTAATIPLGDYVVNGGFDDFGLLEGLPYPWAEAQWGSQDGVVAVMPHEAAPSGKNVVVITQPSQTGLTAIRQHIPGLQKIGAGKRIVARMQAMCDRPEQLTLAIRSFQNSKVLPEHSVTVRHSGDGQWHELTLELALPAENPADEMEVMVFRKSDPDGLGGTALADNVSVFVVD